MSETDDTRPDEDTGFELLGLPQASQEAELRSRMPVELLASQFLDELRRGDRPSVETYARRYPLHAEVIRESFPVMSMLEQARLQHESRAMRRSMPQKFPFTRLGDCELLCELGRGGMGVVYQAREVSSRHVVAVKVLPWRVSMVPEWQDRFLQEADTAIHLRHRHIVPVHRVGQDHGYCYYVMQFINGVSLDRVVERLRETDGVVYRDEISRLHESRPDGFVSGQSPSGSRSSEVATESRARLSRSSWKSFAQIALQVCEALRYAHSQQLLHNDIKPGNILLDASGRAWITDFGVSATMQSAAAELTESAVNGTPRYMAPERLTGPHDGRSDLYSLGCTLYELLTLQPAFTADSEAELLERVQRGPVVPPREIRPEIPRDLERLVMNCLSRSPQRRYQTAEALYADLLRFGRGQRVRSTRRSRMLQWLAGWWSN